MSAIRGQFLWYDLVTRDPDASITFYRDVVGWETTTWQGDDEPTTLFCAARGAVAGVVLLPPDAAADAGPRWLPYVGTYDVDATAVLAQELGGTVRVPPMDIAGVGRMSVLADPAGATFAAMTPARQDVDPAPHGAGTIGWREVVGRDVDEMVSFYRMLFGWRKTGEMPTGPEGEYRMYGLGDQTFGGMYAMANVPPHWLVYITVDALDASLERATARGARVVHGPMTVPSGDRVAILLDPQQIPFALHEHAG